MKKYLLFILFFTIFMINSFATTYYVSNSTDGGSDSNDGLSTSTPFLTVTEAVSRVIDNDIIIIMNVLADQSEPETITIDNDIEIWGYGASTSSIARPLDNSRLFIINSGKIVVFKKFRIHDVQNSFGPAEGGAIYNQGTL